MRASWMVGITVLGWLLLGCQSQSRESSGEKLFPQEADSVFVGAERRVVRPFINEEWVVYYFEGETVDSLAKKIGRSDFFVNEGWRSFHHLKEANHMSSGRGKQPKGSLSSILIFPGKYDFDAEKFISPMGASVVLM